MKIILWLHRYLGVAVGLLMVLWCLSGFVMMYQGWPRVSPQERVQGLPPLVLPLSPADGRRDLSTIPVAEDAAPGSFRVEMLDGAPVLRLPQGVYDLNAGERISEVSEAVARGAALGFAQSRGWGGDVSDAALISYDQWSIQERLAAPLWRVRLGAPSHALIYVSERNGEVVQAATGQERFWTWLGAIPHWLYPRILRENSQLWFQIVVWTSAIGVFLTVTGLYVGIVRFRKRPDGRRSPYRGVWLWHHYTGLGFGVLTLTWVFSGLLTMGPFWPMQSRPFPELGAVNGAMSWGEARPALEAALARPDISGIRQIESAPLAGQSFLLAHYADGRTVRLDANGAPAPLTGMQVRAALTAAGPPLDGATLELLEREDAYYYSRHHNIVTLPVWRATTAEDDPRTIYLNAASGRVVRALDGPARAERWLRSGLHSLDFPGLRARPLWDIVVLVLLGGVTLVCAIGVWLGFGRVKRDWRFLTRKRSRIRQYQPPPSP